MTLYFGTYTKRSSQGIYAVDFDPATGQLSNRRLYSQETNPTYLAFSEDHNLYCVGAENGLGGIAAYDANATLLNRVLEEGAPLCYVSIDEDRQLIYGANYHKGQILVYKRDSNGSLSLADKITHTGSGPHENQTSPHAHYADLTPDQYLVTCDLGTDQVITYTVSEEGRLTELSRYQSATGAGPRHLVFHPFAKIAYLLCELNATIEILIYDGLGQFEHMQTISTLPKDYDGFNATAAIRCSKDGYFVYASNRGHNSIACYQVLKDGSLNLLDIVPSYGQTPRDMNLVADDSYLIVPHQDSDNVTVFARNMETGQLTELSHGFQVPEAVCIVEC